VTPVTVADTDPRSAFVVNPEDMTNWFKQVKEAQLELHGGLLRKVAYEAEDRSRQIVEQATKIALRFGTISTPGAPGLVARGKVTEIGCNGVAVAALKRATELKGKVIIGKGRVAAAALEFKKDPTPAKGVKLEQEKTRLAKYEVELAAVIEKQLSHVTRERLYPQSSKQILEKDIAYEHSPEIPTELVTQWLDVIVGDTASVSRAKAQLQREIGVKILVNGALNTNSDYIGAFDGIYYRSPVEMKLLAQRASVQESPLAVGSVPFFQFGVLAAIPISNGVFQNNRFVVHFTEDGKLKSFEYKEPKARTEEALATVEGNLGILEDSEKAAIEAETNLLKAEKERVDAEKALLEAQGELNNVRDGI
jgi:hypothetical protein